MDYKQAGVDIDEGVRTVRKISQLVDQTRRPGVLGGIGGFGGLFHVASAGLTDPVLVSSVDGVGTKLTVARLAGQYRGVGADLVNHCINDILVQGAAPLFFMDYVAMGRLDADVVAEVVEGMAEACVAAECALLGGETAELPGLYRDGDLDVVGSIVGVVERDRILDGSAIEVGDIALGFHSTGLHTNGYSLARKILFDLKGFTTDSPLYKGGPSVGAALLAVHRCYGPALRPALERGDLHGLAHVTGGGLLENLPRVLPPGLACIVHRDAWEPPELFRLIGEWGDVAEVEMFRTLNMGIGMVAFCSGDDADLILEDAREVGVEGVQIGQIVEGECRVHLA